MSIDINDFIEGLDPSVLSEVSGAQLLQLIRNATPSASRGLIINSDNTPDVGTYPSLARYKWTRPSENNKITRHWNPSINAWEADSPQNLTVGTSQIQDGAVTLAKLYNPSGFPFYLIRVNAAGTGFELWPLTFTNGTINIEAIIKGTNNYFPHVKSDGSAWEFVSADTIAALISNGVLNANQITITGNVNGTIPMQDSATNKLVGLAPGVEGTVLTIASGVPSWRVTTNKITLAAISTEAALLGYSFNSFQFLHGLGVVPRLVKCHIVCAVNDLDYVVGDRLEIDCLLNPADTYRRIPYTIMSNATAVKLAISPGVLTFGTINMATLLTQVLTTANWNIQFQVFA